MKRQYIKPVNELHEVQSHGCILGNTSNISVGGTGTFDVKEDNNEWSFWEEEE